MLIVVKNIQVLSIEMLANSKVSIQSQQGKRLKDSRKIHLQYTSKHFEIFGYEP